MLFKCIYAYHLSFPMQFATDDRTSLDFNNDFKTHTVPSPSRALEWQKHLDQALCK